MNIEKRYKKIDKNIWLDVSQKMELDLWKYNDSTMDKNDWWKNNFENYKSIENEKIETIFEVGCGPFARNIRFVMDGLKIKPKKFLLNDPLLNEYVKFKKPVAEFIKDYNAVCYSVPLEECRLENPVDMIIVINVLDHVYDLELCFKSTYDNLKLGGILILGNDLTSEENFQNTPRNDQNGMLHPIRFDYNDIKMYLEKYKEIFKNMTKPSGYHCGTLFFIGRKI